MAGQCPAVDLAVDHAIHPNAVQQQPALDVGRRAARRGVHPDAATLTAQFTGQRAGADTQWLTQPAVDEARQPAALGVTVMGQACQGVVDVE